METDAVLALMRSVAADVIRPRFRSLSREQIMEKNPGDLVTVADREAETLLTQGLLTDGRDVLVVGEEATHTDPGLLDRLGDAEHAFVVDPIDGTKNFVNGRDDYAVMIGELRHGECVRGWIWQPEHDLAFVAERGRGLTCNGSKVTRSAPPTDIARLRVVTSRPEHEGSHGPIDVGRTAWCCGVDYPWLAQGRVDAIVYSRTMPWDHAPGSLFIEETGGVVRHGDGTTYRPGVRRRGCLVAAADAATWRSVVDTLKSSNGSR